MRLGLFGLQALLAGFSPKYRSVDSLSVLSAITSTQQRLKLYSRIPENGLVVYCGTVVTEDGKEKKLSISFEPFKPINTSLYLCDNKFHTEVCAVRGVVLPRLLH